MKYLKSLYSETRSETSYPKSNQVLSDFYDPRYVPNTEASKNSVNVLKEDN